MSNQASSTDRVAVAAEAAGLEIALLEYPEGTRTADEAAAAVGCQVDQIVKSMIFDADGQLVLALTSGANQVDGELLAALAGATRCGRADVDAVRTHTGFAIGGVPPFGHENSVRTWFDPHLLDFNLVWAAAGTPRHVFALSPAELLRVTGATVSSFTTQT